MLGYLHGLSDAGKYKEDIRADYNEDLRGENIGLQSTARVTGEKKEMAKKNAAKRSKENKTGNMERAREHARWVVNARTNTRVRQLRSQKKKTQE